MWCVIYSRVECCMIFVFIKCDFKLRVVIEVVKSCVVFVVGEV